MILTNRYHVRAIFVDDFDRAVGIFVSFLDEEGKLYRLQPGEMQQVDRNEVFRGWPTPTVEVPVEAAQGLMDDLWSMGLRPTKDQGTPGMLAAQSAHLADLRRYLDMLMFRYITGSQNEPSHKP